MVSDNSSGFGSGFRDLPQESVEAQFVPENICGEGAGCTVYRVRHDGLLVAVKRLSDQHRLNATFIAAYRKEFEIGRRLKHDALPVYRELRADAEDVYIVMDFVDGVTVNDFLNTPEGKEYFSNEDNLRKFLVQLMDAIAYMHRSGVVHCDLKPANIMLRHSDRAVMVIDLDKAYCDTHDLTHGGTLGISDALSGHDKPKAGKDFAAVGRIMDVISNSINKATPHSLNKFRKLCNTQDVTVEKLRRSLQTSAATSKTVWILVAAALIAIGFIFAVLFTLDNKNIDDKGIAAGEAALATDTVSQINAEIGEEIRPGTESGTKPHTESEPTPQPAAAESDAAITDFDVRMSKYIEETTAATAALRSGKLSNDELQTLATKLNELYSSTYNKIKEDYMIQHPEASEFEATTALIKALDNSRTYKIMQSFLKEYVDTVNVRVAKIK